MKTAVVTGGAGFIGAAVARKLAAEGFTVHLAGMSTERDPLTPARIAACEKPRPASQTRCLTPLPR